MKRRIFKRVDNAAINGEHLLKRASSMHGPDKPIQLRIVADDLGLSIEGVEVLLKDLAGKDWICSKGEKWFLSEAGWTHGRKLLRAHRIYESYLAQETGLSPADWHSEADKIEHTLDAEAIDEMAAALNRPRFDPHGDAIPTRSLNMPEVDGFLLSQVSEDGLYKIRHIEDEPSEPFERLISMGIAPALVLDIHPLNAGRFLARWAGLEQVLDSSQAAALLVEKCSSEKPESLPNGTLYKISNGEEAVIHSVSPAVRGLERRRLMDLGFVPGSKVVREGSAPFNGPGRFRVRGTVQALRSEQAKNIFIN